MQTIEKQSSSGVVLGLSPGKQDRYTCICCRVKFDSVELQRSHFKTEWHLYNLKRKVCLLDPIDVESFNHIQQKSINDRDNDNESESSYGFVHLNRKDDLDQSSSDCQTIDTEDWEKVDEYDLDDDELLDADYNDDEVVDLLEKMVRSDTCLFCDRKSTNIRSNISHMNQMHGFFIPEERYLIDLEGLMDYLGFKVGAGSTCLWCNKQFASLHGVRLHMQNKDHCKILYDQAQAIEEFKEFYDYSSQETITMKPIDELVLAAGNSRPRRRSETECSRSPAKHRSVYIRQQQQQQLVVVPQDRTAMAEMNRTKRSIKKFNSSRAKVLLQVGLMNNQTMRARFRHQNPI